MPQGLGSYRISPSDPELSFDVDKFLRNAAAVLKAAGITTQAQLDTAISNISSSTGMNSSAVTGEVALLKLITLNP